MSHINRNTWAIFPLLSILSMSPAQLQTKQASRWIASVGETMQEVSKHPLFDQLITKVEKRETSKAVDAGTFFEKIQAINGSLNKERFSFKKNLAEKNEVSKQRQGLETLVSDVVLIEEDLKILQDRKLLDVSSAQSAQAAVSGLKDQTESLLVHLHANEELVGGAKADSNKEEIKAPAPVVAEPEKPEEPKAEVPVVSEPLQAQEPQPETPVVAEPVKPEEPGKGPQAVASAAKTETPVEDQKKDTSTDLQAKTEVPEKEVCTDKKEKVLTEPVENLVADQSMIMQQFQSMMMQHMMNVTNMMMLQQYQIYQLQKQLPNQGPVNQQAYQYAAPTQGGTWVFQPSAGPQPGQMYPGQFPPMAPTQGYNGWGLQPQTYFAPDPRLTPMPVQPGQFGGPQLGFNMSSGPGAATFPI